MTTCFFQLLAVYRTCWMEPMGRALCLRFFFSTVFARLVLTPSLPALKNVYRQQDPGTTYGSVMRNTVKQRGVFGFYRGLSSMVYFAAPKAAIRFGGFEFCSGLLSTADGGDKYGLGAVRTFLCACGLRVVALSSMALLQYCCVCGCDPVGNRSTYSSATCRACCDFVLL